MVERVHVLVNATNVDEAMGDVEVRVTPNGNQQNPKNVQRQQFWAGKHFCIRGVRHDTSSPQAHHDTFPSCELKDAESPVVKVVQHVRYAWPGR